MKKAFIVLGLLCSFLSAAQTKNLAGLDAFFNKLETENKAMGTVSIFENGKETYQKSIGFMNVQSKKEPMLLQNSGLDQFQKPLRQPSFYN